MRKVLIWVFCLLCAACALAAGDEDHRMEGAKRGRTLILRVPQEWAAEMIEEARSEEDFDALVDSFSWGPASWTWRNAAAEWADVELFGGAGEADWIDYRCAQGNTAMSVDRADGYWYFTLRFSGKIGREVELDGELYRVEIERGEDMLRAVELGCKHVDFIIEPEDMSGEGPYFSAEYGGMRVELFRALDAVAAVITEADADPDLLMSVLFCIGGEKAALMNGYMDGGNAIFCCVLDDAQARAIEAGAQAELDRGSFADLADFDGAEYAPAQKGTGKWGVVDRAGNWVVPPEYLRVLRPETKYYRSDITFPFFCEDGEGVIALDGGTLEEILRVRDAEYFDVSYENPSVALVECFDGVKAYSLRSGEKLMETDTPTWGMADPEEERVFIKARYYYGTEGWPERLVIQHDADNGAEVRCYIADNYGNRISQDYQLITPLIWKDGRGVFMTERSVERSGRSAENFGLDPDGVVEDWSSTWRCGLIDQDGKVIAEEKYVSIRILSMDRVRLGCVDGTFVEIGLG